MGALCLIACFAVGRTAAQTVPGDTPKRVLIINSYHRGFPWTDNTLAGMESVFKDGKQNIDLHVEFMDTKRTTDRGHLQRLFTLYRSKFEQIKFDLIMVADNDAFHFIVRHRDALFPRTPVVFCGVNALNQHLARMVSLMTGVVEHYDMKATVEAALRIHPDAREAIAVSNGTPIGLLKKRLFNEAVSEVAKNLKSSVLDDPVLTNFEALIRNKGRDTIVFLLGYFVDRSGVVIPPEVSTPVVAKYDVPVYGVLEQFLGYGIIGGKLLSGYHQGVVAARMGIRILQGEPVEKIPVEQRSPNVFMFDHKQLVRFGIDESLLPQGSLIINRPEVPASKPVSSETSGRMAWEGTALLVLLGLAIITALFVLYIRTRRKAEESTDQMAADLERRVAARTEELMKANDDLRAKMAEMKQAEALRVKSHLRFQALFEHAPVPVFLVDHLGRYTDCNAKMADFFECTRTEVLAMDARAIVPGDLLAKLLEDAEESGKVYTLEATCEARGKKKTLLIALVPLVLDGERYVYGVGQDITVLKAEVAEAAARAELDRVVLRSLPLAALVSDRKGVVQFGTRGFEKLVGFTVGDIPTIEAWLEKACPDKDQRTKVIASWLKTLSAEDTEKEGVESIECPIQTRNGETVFAALTFIPVRDRVAIVLERIREKKPSEAKAAVTRPQEPIETLAAGIAHDFNNLLLVILGNISLAKTGVTQEDGVLERLVEAERAAMMTKDLIQQLITFSKGGELSKRAMMITPLVMEVTRATLSNTKIKGKYVISDDLLPVEVDEGQIKQVIGTILRNAREAMPAGGTVTITFENVKVTRDDYLPLSDGVYVRISVRDEGPGIKEEHLRRVFDPYFTTKDPGSQKGVGLGLAIAYSIVKKHGGHIAVESSVGGGTTFYVYLPAYGTEEEGVPGVSEVPEAKVESKGRILVMDDSKAVREVTGAMLNHLGYDVEFAREGREAVSLYRDARESEKPFDAVILDLTVQGGMGGKEAMQLLLAIDPGVKAVISGGYSGDPIMSEYPKYGFKTAILKPYKMEELEEILERIIRGGHQPS